MRLGDAGLCVVFVSYAPVRQDEIAGWEGVPILVLEDPLVYLTVTLARTTTSDGTEIRNFNNVSEIKSCPSNGAVLRGQSPMRITTSSPIA